MNQSDLFGFSPHSLYKPHQIPLLRMGGVAAACVDTRIDGVFVMIQHHVPMLGAVVLNDPSGRTLCLIADKKNVGAMIFDQGFEIVHDSTAGAHAAGSYDNGRSAGLFQVAHRPLMRLMGIDGHCRFQQKWRLPLETGRNRSAVTACQQRSVHGRNR